MARNLVELADCSFPFPSFPLFPSTGNRASAQRSRDAKKNHQQALEDRVRELEFALAQATLGNGAAPSTPSSAHPIASTSTLLPVGVPVSVPLAPPPNPAWLARRRELERENSELRGRVGKLEELVRGLVGVLGRGMENAAANSSSMEAGPSQVAGGVEQMEQVREEDKGCKMEVDDGGWMLGGEVSPASSSNLDLTYSPSSNNPSTNNHASTLGSPSASSYLSNSPYLSLGSSALPPSPPALDFSIASSSSTDPYSYPSDPSSSTNTLLSPTLDFTSFLNFPTSRPSTPNFLLSSPSNALHLSNQSFSSSSSSSRNSNVLASPSSSTSTNPPSARWLPQQRASSISSDRTTRTSRSALEQQDQIDSTTTAATTATTPQPLSTNPSSPSGSLNLTPRLALIPLTKSTTTEQPRKKQPTSSAAESSAAQDRLRAQRSGLGRGSRFLGRVFRGAAAALTEQSSSASMSMGGPSSGGMVSSTSTFASPLNLNLNQFLMPRSQTPVLGFAGRAVESGPMQMAV